VKSSSIVLFGTIAVAIDGFERSLRGLAHFDVGVGRELA
jgi:hypothetical protein